MRFYRVILPAAWLGTAWTSWHHPGDEYAMCFVGALPGWWILPLLPDGDIKHVLLPVLAAGAASVTFAGWTMDRLRINRPIWLAAVVFLAALLVGWTLWQYPTYQRAMAKNGSLTAYVAAAVNFAMSGTALVAMLLTPLWRLVWHLIRSRTTATSSRTD